MQPAPVIRSAVILAWLAAAALATAEIQVGDSAEKVRAELGEPSGSIRASNYELLQFDRGRVEIREGVVTHVELVSPDEAVKLKAIREQQARDLKVRQGQERAARITQGTEARDRALQNAEFLTSSGERQVQFWEDFRRRYPEVPVGSEYAAALAKRDADAARADAEWRLANVEQRVADAEARAAQAERDAEDARRESQRRYVYYSTPYYNSGYVGCPPLRTPYSHGRPYPATAYPYSHGYSVVAPSPYHERASSIRFRMNF